MCEEVAQLVRVLGAAGLPSRPEATCSGPWTFWLDIWPGCVMIYDAWTCSDRLRGPAMSASGPQVLVYSLRRPRHLGCSETI